MPSSEHQTTIEHSGAIQATALVERYEALLQSALAFGSAGSVAEALDILSGALLCTINFDTVALYLSRGAPVAGYAWYRLSRNTDHPQFTAQSETPVEGEIGLLAFEKNSAARSALEQSAVQSVCAVPLTTPRGSLGSITFCTSQPD